MADFGYDVSDFKSVDEIFGHIDDFKLLLERAHNLGLKILIDQVWCHTSITHPWFIESSSSKSNPKADWFVWQDANEKTELPNNWLSIFGGPAWEWHPQMQQYYLHHFLKEQPALNWYNKEVQEAMLVVAKFWLDLGVDGFRFDVVNFLALDNQLRNNPRRSEQQALPAGGDPSMAFF